MLGKYSPVAFEPEKYGVDYYKNPEWDLALDYYFTAENCLGLQEALEVFEKFEQDHDPKWDVGAAVREYVFLYIDHFGAIDLPQLQIPPDQRPQYYANPVGMA